MTAGDTSFYREMAGLIREGRAGEAVSRLQRRLGDAPDDEVAASLLGSALLRADRSDEALAVLRDSATRRPDSPAAQADLGFALMTTGDDAGALAAFERAVAIDARFYPGWNSLSRVAYRAGRHGRAREAFARAREVDPHAGAFRDVQAAMSAERYAEAERRCRELLTRQPGYPQAAYTLAQLAARVGAHEEGAAILERALEYFPADANLRAARVVALEEAGRYAAALAEARSLTALDPDTAGAWLVRGRVHGHCGHYADCLDSYDRALALAGDDAPTRASIELLRGHVLKILGRREDAIAAYRDSLRLDPGSGAGWWALADMKTLRFDDGDVAAMQAVADDGSLRPEQRAQAAFALGKAHEDREEWDRAFACYRRGNELRPDAGFDPAAFERGIDALIEAYDENTLAARAVPAPEGPRPIFIVGLPRAGSTLVEQILASHSRVEGTMELATLPNLVRRITIDGGRRKLDYPASMRSFSPRELAAYGQTYLDDTAMYRTDCACFIDKLPTNFDKLGLIHMILPQAIVIDARRHPLDCGFSAYKQHFAGGHPWSAKLEHIGCYYNGYLRLMDHWDAVLPGKALCVRYEQLVADTEVWTRRLLEHCGLDFEDACLRFFENRRPVRTASSEQVRQPIYRKGIGHWRHFATELEPLAAALRPATLARFGS